MRIWPVIIFAAALHLSSIAEPGEPIYGSGLDVDGKCICSNPVPYMHGDCLFRIVLEFRNLYSIKTNSITKAYFGRDGQWHSCSSAYDNLVSWTNRMQNFDFVYRYRTVDSLSEWMSVSMSDEWRITERPVAPPSLVEGESCDMEYFVRGYMWNPYYSYVDYSGQGLGVPEYTERDDDDTTARNYRATPSRMNLTTAGNWVRIKPFRTRLESLTIYDGVTAAEFENVTNSPSNYEDPNTAGFFIRSVVRDDKGIGVAFDTEEDPPYSVAVYKIHDIGLSRRRPLQHVVVSNNFAHIPCGGYFNETVFVQVGNNLGIESDITPDELYLYRQRKDRVSFDTSDAPKVEKPNRMHLVSNDKWSGFVPCQSNVISISVSGMLPFANSSDPVIRDGSWYGRYTYLFPLTGQRGITVTNWTMRAGTIIPPTEFHFPSGVESYGRGYRITIDERYGSVDVRRAYSYMDGRSDEYILPRGYKTLSVNGGRYGVSTDWTGIEYWQKYTNAVPGVIYGNGVPN